MFSKIFLICTTLFLQFCICDADDEVAVERGPFQNEPIELKPMYHRLEHYQERIPDFWLENEPRPHVHGDMGPNADQLHRHYSKYEDYATSEFITDPPSNEESDKASPIGQDTNEYEKWSRAKALSPSETLSLKQTPLDPFDFFPDNPFGFENETGFGFGQDDIGLEEFQGKVRDNVEAEEDPFKNIATRKPTTEISSDKNVEKTLDLFEKEKAEISRPQEGFIPEEFPPGGDSDLLGKNRPNEPFPDLTKGDRIDEATLEDFRKLPDGLSRTGSSDESDSSNCCPCCKKGRKKSRCNDDEKGCINPFVRPHHPHVFGQPPAPCCAEAQPPAPCCPQLPTCCPTPLPCCPPLEPIRCCPSFSTCCEPGRVDCRACRSLKQIAIRSKRNGCLSCSRKKRESLLEEAIIHIRQKRTCTSCPKGRVKRQQEKSCSTCNNRNDRVKRRTEIEDFQKMRAHHLKTCTPCAVGSSPRVMKRAADFEDASFDPFSQCDNSCCAYNKCIYTKLIRTSSLSNKHG